ncbi:MAG: Holliday junction resolvase [Dehalococcoidales bacterium]|nr:Holliday junction resolvase [Dehalococcoidales bacterium]
MGAAIAITVLAAVLIIVLSIYIMRLIYEKRFRDWRDQAIVQWQKALEEAKKVAVAQSRAVLGGKFTEQIVPFLPGFRYDPTEVRFIGSPVDMIVFPGLARGNPEEIVILEVKSGRNPELTPVQKRLRELVENSMVRWEEIHQVIDGADETAGA